MTWTKIFSSQTPFPDGVPTYSLPVVSYRRLLAGDLAESDKIFGACKETGFFLLDLAGPPQGEMFLKDAQGILRLTEHFSELDDAEKSQYRLQQPHHIFGWKGIGAAKLENGSPDRYEFYNISQDSILGTGAPQAHPAMICNSEKLLRSFALHARDVCALILSRLDTHLNLPSGTLLKLHQIDEASKTTIRLLHSPSTQSAGDHSRDPKSPARLLLGHTDNGTLAVLFNILGGLQILPPSLSPESDSSWRYIRPVPNCAIVNVGDALCQWSGGLLRSGMHRVVSPPGDQALLRRLSFVYVLKPGNKASMRRLMGAEEEGGGMRGKDGQCSYEEWLLVKSRATAEGKSVVRIGGT